MTSDRQIAIDTNKSCCGSLCVSKLGKTNLRILREKYLSHMQQYLDHIVTKNSTHVEYYLTLSTKYCRISFKIAYSIDNSRLYRIQQRLVNGSWVPFDKNICGSKGLIGLHAMRWMEIYFSKQCDVIPTIGRLHLLDNFTHHEVYQAYKDEMLLENVHYIQYQHFNRLWPTNERIRPVGRARSGFHHHA